MLSRALRLATVTFLIGCLTAAAVHAVENLEAGKTPGQIFAGTCNACHKSPRGLLKTVPPSSLPNFLRQHYTTSSDMASVLASYLVSNGATDTRYQAKDGKEAKQKDGAKEGAKEAGRPPVEQGTKQARLPRPGETPDVMRPEGPAQAVNDKGKKDKGKKGRPEEPARTEPSAEPPKETARRDDGAKPASEPKPAEPKASEPKTESAKVEPSAPVQTRPDPVPPVTPAPAATAAVAPSSAPAAAAGPSLAPPPVQPLDTPSTASELKPVMELPKAPAVAAAPALPPVPPAGPPAVPISQ